MYTLSAPLYDAIYAAIGKDYPAEAVQVRSLIVERCPAAATLLDVGCGTGMHLEQFAKWFAVEGADMDAEMLGLARKRLPDVPLHEADMASLDLGDCRFDAVVTLFSAVGHLMTVERLNAAVAAMARHLNPGGVLIVEPWLSAEAYRTGKVSANFVNEPDLKVARMTLGERDGMISRMVMHYLVATPDGVSRFSEPMELALYTDAEYTGAFESAGLVTERLEGGPTGRGLYVGVYPV